MKALAITFLLLIQFSWANAQSSKDNIVDLKTYKVEFYKYVELMDMKGMFKVVIPQLLGNFKESLGDKVPEKYWSEMEKEFLSSELDTMIERLVPVYMKYLVLSDLKELNKFLVSPSGKAFVKAQNEVQPESMEIGQEWGRALAGKVMAKLEKDGYNLK